MGFIVTFFTLPTSILAFVIGILYGLIISKSFSYRRAVYSGLLISFVVILAVYLLLSFQLGTTCATLDGSPCTLSQSQIVRNVSSTIIAATPTMLLYVVSSTVGVLIGGYIARFVGRSSIG